MPATASVFRNYLNPVFVETGTHLGAGVAAALEAGFAKVYSVELGERPYQEALRRFAHDPRVQLRHGHCLDFLRDLLPLLNTPATFWLDAHDSGPGTVKGPYDPPLLYELELIRQQGVTEHTLLIDDMRGYDRTEIEKHVLQINPAYRISYVDGRHSDDRDYPEFLLDILAAQP